MLSRVLFGCAALVLFAPALAMAQNISNDAGPFEVIFGGVGQNDKNFHNGGVSLDGNLGWYATRNLELSVRDAVSYDDFGAGHAWTNSVRGALDFNFNFDRVQPFVGA